MKEPLRWAAADKSDKMSIRSWNYPRNSQDKQISTLCTYATISSCVHVPCHLLIILLCQARHKDASYFRNETTKCAKYHTNQMSEGQRALSDHMKNIYHQR